MIFNVDKFLDITLSKAHKVLAKYPQFSIRPEIIKIIADVNYQVPHISIKDAYALGFSKGLEAAKANAQKEGAAK